MGTIKEALKISGIPAFIAGLCCFSPLVLVFLGIGTVSWGAGLANLLYGDYRWLFRLVGLFSLIIALVIYFRRKGGICTIDQAVKKRNKIINLVIISLVTAIILYIIWLYVILHYIGVFAGLWS
ncbi:hypothetical protein HYT58_02925 [Candidatus Woesearchaeota archaeon]|nr:hypothetical protein [Candidatus Woesearchaeota archaeon]